MNRRLCLTFATLASACRVGSGAGDGVGTEATGSGETDPGGGTTEGMATGGEDGTGGGGDTQGEGSSGGTTGGEVPDPPGGCDLDRAKRTPVDGFWDWSRAGYRGGQVLPTEGASTVDAVAFGVVADDGIDDSAALQAAIDSVEGGSYDAFTVLALPAGQIDLSEEIHVDQGFIIIRGAGSDLADEHTEIVVRPSETMRYPGVANGGTEPDFEGLDGDGGKGRWLWPGRGLFRVQTRDVQESYQSAYEAAPAERSDVFEGTVNVHWKSGLDVAQGGVFAARKGETVVPIDASDTSRMASIRVGGPVWVGAANSHAMYDRQGVLAADRSNTHMRAQVFTAVAVDEGARTVTLDRPLEFDVPANSVSDGSEAIDGNPYVSRVVPLAVVEGVGFEDFVMRYALEGLPRPGGGTVDLTAADARNEYGNLAPEYALHGIVFKWAMNAWVRDVRIEMAGSHPIVTEVAKNLRIERVVMDGSWNKGKGGHGYLRGSRVWDSVYGCNTTRGLRHFTFQWSSSGNVAYGNDFDSDLNLHGGWERHNLFEGNRVNVPFAHRSGNCSVNCGAEPLDEGTWYPIWWGAGPKAGGWSGATGPQNVFFRNELRKQLAEGGEMVDYLPYYDSGGGLDGTAFTFGWGADGEWIPLSVGGSPIADWSGHETTDFSQADNEGVERRTIDVASLYFAD